MSRCNRITTYPARTSMAMPDAPLRSGRGSGALSSAATPELLKLLTFLSPAFPVGSFSYSHGLEWLIESGAIATAEALRSWIGDLLEIGGGWNDAVLFAEASRLAVSSEPELLLAIAELTEAMAPSKERHLETMAQGRAFLAAVSVAWPCAPVDRLIQAGGAAYPVAVAAAAAGHAIAPDAALAAWLNAFTANLVSVGVRLIPLGQSAGLEVLAKLHPLIGAVAERAARSTLDDLGAATVLSDIAAMRHEEQFSRVFRT